MKTNLEDLICDELNRLDKLGECEVDTSVVRGWIKEFNEQNKQIESEVKQELQSIISEWHESKFKKPLIEIIRERLNK